MAKWKLCRQTYGSDTYEFTEGDEVTIGRGNKNTIILTSLNISRQHCVINVKRDEVTIIDLASANGIFVGLKKIAPNTPFSLSDNDIIGIGWTDGAPLARINDAEKFVFKLQKISVIDRIQFQNENELQHIELELAKLHDSQDKPVIKKSSPISLSLKRKSSTGNQTNNVSNNETPKDIPDCNSENGNNMIQGPVKKFKSNFIFEDIKEEPLIKVENEDLQYEAFNIKQECFDDEPQLIIDSDSNDSDSEQWYARLSQNSPRKSFINFSDNRKSGESQQDSSYSQLDDDVIFVGTDVKSNNESDEELYVDDIITILPPSVNKIDDKCDKKNIAEDNIIFKKNDNNIFDKPDTFNILQEKEKEKTVSEELPKALPETVIQNNKLITKTTQLIDFVDRTFQPSKKSDNSPKSKIKKKNDKVGSKSSSSKIQITNAQKEERKKKLREIASKGKGDDKQDNSNLTKTTDESISTLKVNAKVTTSNRGAFLADVDPVISKPKKRKSSADTKNSTPMHNVNEDSNKSDNKNSEESSENTRVKEVKLKFYKKTTNGVLAHANVPTNCPSPPSPTSKNMNKALEETNSSEGSGPVISKSTKRKISVDCKNTTTSHNPGIESNKKDRRNSEKSLENTEIRNQTPILNKELSNSTKRKNSVDCKNTTTSHSSEIGNSDKKDRRNSEKSLENNEKKDQTPTLNKEVEKEFHHKTTNGIRIHVPKSYPSPPLIISENKNKALDKAQSTREIENKNNHISTDKRTNKNLKNTQKLNNTILQFEQNHESVTKCSTIVDHLIDSDTVKSPGQNENSTEANMQFKIRTNLNVAPLKRNKPELKSSLKTILKPLKENKEPDKKSSKRVSFSNKQPEVREFEIEQGHQMKKTSTVKTALLPARHNIPTFSLEKFALMRILRWNPQWLDEQNNCTEPPPILGHNNVFQAIPHTFSSHTQYVELIGDLLLMEIWDCLTQGYVKTQNENNYHEMRIESLPLALPQKHGLELFNLSVNVSLPTTHIKLVPREGEIMMVRFGGDWQFCRFFFVQNVRCLPSPPNNVNSFFSISLQTSYTEKITMLQRGSVMYGKCLAYINKDLKLYEAMEYLSRSPLSEVILNPKPEHFLMSEAECRFSMESQWTTPLNESQKKAVMHAVAAAFGDKPRIQMVQGPPGTGKSRVISAIVMSYFYDEVGKKQKNRGKILICATSNAAVDELVIRLLDIRQSLPHPERLNMVRVGRADAMHPRAHDISSTRLAQRDAARALPDAAPALSAEISLLEAKRNKWQSNAMSATDDARVAYCQNRIAEITKKIAMFRGSAECAPEQLAQAERRVLERADVVLTTLASAHSYKMRGMRRIALCIVDEAGQAVELETLVPLTLAVTRLVLVGDPQQLPGFICSQRAKKYGLGESLFSRLSSCAETWDESASVLLNCQYRMHPHIADYPNRAFYDGQVRDAPPPPLACIAAVAPYTVLAIHSGDKMQGTSGANVTEAWGVARVALALRSLLRAAGPPAHPAPAAPAPAAPAPSLAVITPYVAQRELVRRHLRVLLQAEGGEAAGECDVEVNTVDSFQGQERDVVIVSLARSHGLGFLAEAGRMNVLLTRARHALVLCLNPVALEKNNQWSSLLEKAQNKNMYRILPLNMCQHPSVQKVSHQEILQYIACNPPSVVNNPVPHLSRNRPRKNRRKRNHVSHTR